MSAKRKTADERFLADQVRRIRQLVDQLTLARKSVSSDSGAVSGLRDTATPRPLESVRDYRTYDPRIDEPQRLRPRVGPIAHSERHTSSVRHRKR